MAIYSEIPTYIEIENKSCAAIPCRCYKGVYAHDICTPRRLALELAMVPSACGRIGRGELTLQQTC